MYDRLYLRITFLASTGISQTLAQSTELARLSQGRVGGASLWNPLSFPRCQRFQINTNEPCPCKCCDKTPITNLRTAPHELSTLSRFRFRRFRGGELFWHQIAQSIFCDSRCGNWAASAAAACSMCGCAWVCVKVGVCVCVVHFRACCWSLALPQLNSQFTVGWRSANVAQNEKE